MDSIPFYVIKESMHNECKPHEQPHPSLKALHLAIDRCSFSDNLRVDPWRLEWGHKHKAVKEIKWGIAARTRLEAAATTVQTMDARFEYCILLFIYI